MTSSLTAAYIFGSVARGQADNLSDLDILAVVKTGGGKVDDGVVMDLIPAEMRDLKLSISWYGEDRLRQMFENGELFAWHLSTETKAIYDPKGFLSDLGSPSEYYDGASDVESFIKVFNGIEFQVHSSPHNAAYETGLVYVCVRNIAMAASSALCAVPDFSRYSAFALEGVRPCPITRAEFEITMAARMASQRGYEPPSQATASFVLDLVARLGPWLDEVHHAVKRISHERWRTPQSV